jgi:diamine N-acetyltransferase
MEVSLRKITADTVRSVTDLSVRPEQSHAVASNAISLAEALFYEEAWYRAIYYGESLVGFVMLYDERLRQCPSSEPKVILWRFMIDADFQGQGIGKTALKLVVEWVRSHPKVSTLITSYVPGPYSPEGFYLSQGFQPTGEIDDGEIVLKLPIH